jgi:MOSC domain-containing protein YiiM
MKELVGKVLNVFITDANTQQTEEKECLEVDMQGIISDKHYDKKPMRSILLTTQNSYQILENESIYCNPGSLGENILIDYNPYSLPMGTKIMVGNAVLELTIPCTLCNHLAIIDEKVPLLLKKDRGVFAKVIQTGTIVRGDKVWLIP